MYPSRERHTKQGNWEDVQPEIPQSDRLDFVTLSTRAAVSKARVFKVFASHIAP